MGVFFGTDGLRGKFGECLTSEISFRVGNALTRLSENSIKILIGADTRCSSDCLMLSFSAGAVQGGADVTFVGVCPTAGVSYLTKNYGFDYGVVISASHNPAEFNGIKIFNKNGTKIGDILERKIERFLLINKCVSFEKLGKFKSDLKLTCKYEKFLEKTVQKEIKNHNNFSGLKIVLDCSNGAASEIAPKIFKKLGAEVLCVGNLPNGTNINQDCGSLNIDCLKAETIKNNADLGFAYDGDSDRLIAVSKTGNIVDGDQIIYIFAHYYLKYGRLNQKTVVGTKHTNIGIEKALLKSKINLIRTDVGDKYVSEALEKNHLIIGGEQSGHVFILDKLQTGDGILNSLLLTTICQNENLSLCELMCKKTHYQTNLSVQVESKEKVLKSDELNLIIKKFEQKINGRIMVRASGTEPVVRVMAENEDESLSKTTAKKIEKIIKKIDRCKLCVE